MKRALEIHIAGLENEFMNLNGTGKRAEWIAEEIAKLQQIIRFEK